MKRMSDGSKTPRRSNDVRIGLVGLDTSHVSAFTRILNDATSRDHVSGGRVVAGYPGGSPDFEPSASRVEGFTAELRDELDVDIMDTPEAVAEASELVFITAVDARAHLELFKRVVSFKRPTFIDKPIATSLVDAKEIFRLAHEVGIPLMSCSSLRYAEPLQEALASAPQDIGGIVGCDVFGPMQIQPTQPGLFWYGVHIAEMIFTIMGTGCQEVKATANDDFDLIAAIWNDGRMASFRGARRGHSKFGAVLHGEKGARYVDPSAGKKSYYASMLEVILRTLPNGKSDIPPETTLEIIQFIEAANESREMGRAVKL